MRSNDPDRIVASVDDIDRNLEQIERVAVSRPESATIRLLRNNGSRFSTTRRTAASKQGYNKSADVGRSSPHSLSADMLTARFFGFVPRTTIPLHGGQARRSDADAPSDQYRAIGVCSDGCGDRGTRDSARKPSLGCPFDRSRISESLTDSDLLPRLPFSNRPPPDRRKFGSMSLSLFVGWR